MVTEFIAECEKNNNAFESLYEFPKINSDKEVDEGIISQIK